MKRFGPMLLLALPYLVALVLEAVDSSPDQLLHLWPDMVTAMKTLVTMLPRT